VPTALLVGCDDGALAAALAEVLTDVGASLAPDRDLGGDADVLLLLLGDPLDVGPWLALYAARARQIPVIVLLSFHDAHLAAQARACGAVACHGLDQPVAQLAATLAQVLNPRVEEERRS
jgi:DNA-binding NarL/FixJ family response regulator